MTPPPLPTPPLSVLLGLKKLYLLMHKYAVMRLKHVKCIDTVLNNQPVDKCTLKTLPCTHTHTHMHKHTHTLTLKSNKGKEVQLQQFTGGYLAGEAAAGWSGRAGPGRWAETLWSEVPAPTDTACATSLPLSASCRCSCTSLTHQTSTTLPLGLLRSDTAHHTH